MSAAITKLRSLMLGIADVSALIALANALAPVSYKTVVGHTMKLTKYPLAERD